MRERLLPVQKGAALDVNPVHDYNASLHMQAHMQQVHMDLAVCSRSESFACAADLKPDVYPGQQMLSTDKYAHLQHHFGAGTPCPCFQSANTTAGR